MKLKMIRKFQRRNLKIFIDSLWKIEFYHLKMFSRNYLNEDNNTINLSLSHYSVSLNNYLKFN